MEAGDWRSVSGRLEAFRIELARIGANPMHWMHKAASCLETNLQHPTSNLRPLTVKDGKTL